MSLDVEDTVSSTLALVPDDTGGFPRITGRITDRALIPLGAILPVIIGIIGICETDDGHADPESRFSRFWWNGASRKVACDLVR